MSTLNPSQAVWSASLTVVESSSKSTLPPPPPPPSHLELPGSPSKPELVNATGGTLTVRWEKPIRIGESPLEGYQVSQQA